MAYRSRKKRKYRPKSGSQNKSKDHLIVFLSFVVLIETLLILFLLPNITQKEARPPDSKRKVSVSEKKSKSKPSVPVVPVPGKRIAKVTWPAKKSEPIKKIIDKQILPKRIKGEIAIVLDDWGYNASHLSLLEEINSPITVAILPFLPYSKTVAKFAKQHNIGIIIHMPMEPKEQEKHVLEANTLKTNMSEGKIVTLLDDAFINIAYAQGINNHMGSLATENRKLMGIVFKQLKKRKKFFLDSYVTNNSVCKELAKNNGVRFAKRSIFLDNSSNSAYIRGQLMELASEAETKGSAIGIGHDRKNTLLVLKDVVPQLEKEGYRFVLVSELVE